jgi:SAM-dependent methyltransferase
MVSGSVGSSESGEGNESSVAPAPQEREARSTHSSRDAVSMAPMAGASTDVFDHAPSEIVRLTETFWALNGSDFVREQEGLEIGAYRGGNLLRISPFIGRMTGFEAIAAERGIGESRVRGKPGLSMRAFAGVPLSVPDDAVDLVLIDLTRPAFELASPLDAALREARRVLRPDGRVLLLAILDSPAGNRARDAWIERLAAAGIPRDPPPALMRADACERVIEAAGFEAKVEALGDALLVGRGDVPPE